VVDDVADRTSAQHPETLRELERLDERVVRQVRAARDPAAGSRAKRRDGERT
jgi:hypothetical protein